MAINFVSGDRKSKVVWNFVTSDKILDHIQKRAREVLDVDSKDKSALQAYTATQKILDMKLPVRNNNQYRIDLRKSGIYFSSSWDNKVIKDAKVMALPALGRVGYKTNIAKSERDVDLGEGEIVKLLELAPEINKHFKKIEKFAEECGFLNGILMPSSKQSVSHAIRFLRKINQQEGVFENSNLEKEYSQNMAYAIYCSTKNKIFDIDESGYLDKDFAVGPISRALLFESATKARMSAQKLSGANNYIQVVKIEVSLKGFEGEPILNGRQYSTDKIKAAYAKTNKKDMQEKIETENAKDSRRNIKKRKL